MKPLLAIILFSFSCTDLNEQTANSDLEFSKADIAKKNTKADSVVDYCQRFGWYGDGECDTFCLHEDVLDCRPEAEVECAALCQNRENNLCVTKLACEDKCRNEIDNWSDDQVEGFAECLGHPLCYRTVDQCMRTHSTVGFCEDACSEQEDNQFGWCGATECVQYCWDNIDSWDKPTEQAFLLCANENPLCYQTMENCISYQK